MAVPNKSVRILLVGDDGVGKTSLILSLVTEEFPDEVPTRAEEITIPADVTPEKVPTHIVDFSFADQTEDDLRDELIRADVICVVYAINDDDSIERITSYWLPTVFEVCGRGENNRKPVVLVGNKSDTMETEGAKMNEILEIMDEYPEVETCIECSAYDLKNISELFYYAQKAVLHPTSPLYSNEEQQLTEKCQRGLIRIFKICDLDNDNLLNDLELNEFQKRCFKNPLPPHGILEVKNIVQRNLEEGVVPGGITLQGFLFLHTLFIQKGRQETTWTALRRFGYGSDLELRDDYMQPHLQVDPDCSVELSSSGLDFIMELFYKHDQDEDDALSPEELSNMCSICDRRPWVSNQLSASCTNEQGNITAEGFVAQWILWTYLKPQWTLEHLAHFGYIQGDMENQLSGLRVTRAKAIDVQKRKSTRSVFRVHVVGEEKVGKTSFLQAFLDRSIKDHPTTTPIIKQNNSAVSLDSGHDSPQNTSDVDVSKDHNAKLVGSEQSVSADTPATATDESAGLSSHAINSVQLKRKEVHLILEKVSVSDAVQTDTLESCDVVCFLIDSTNPMSTKNLKAFIESKPKETPFLCIATKSDLRSRNQQFDPEVHKLLALHSHYPIQYFSAVDEASIDQKIFTKIAQLATHAYAGSYSSEGSITKYVVGLGLVASALAAAGFIIYRKMKRGAPQAAIAS